MVTLRFRRASGNNVTQNKETTVNDHDTIITNREEGASSHTVTIDAKDKDDKVEVTLKDVNIDASSRSEAAVSVTGKGDTTIELDGDNELKSGAGHAGLEHNKTDTSGELTIQDKDNNGSLEAAGGFKGAGIGSAGSNDAQVKITGGNITATTSDDWGAGIGSGSYGTGTVEITGGEINATGGYLGAGIGGGCNGSGNVTISGGTITAAGSDGAAGIGGGYYNGATVTITGDAVIKNASSTKYGAGIGGGNGSDGNVTISGNAKSRMRPAATVRQASAAAHLVPPIKSATVTWSSRIMPKSTMCRAALMAQASAVVFMVSAM